MTDTERAMMHSNLRDIEDLYAALQALMPILAGDLYELRESSGYNLSAAVTEALTTSGVAYDPSALVKRVRDGLLARENW